MNLLRSLCFVSSCLCLSVFSHYTNNKRQQQTTNNNKPPTIDTQDRTTHNRKHGRARCREKADRKESEVAGRCIHTCPSHISVSKSRSLLSLNNNQPTIKHNRHEAFQSQHRKSIASAFQLCEEGGNDCIRLTSLQRSAANLLPTPCCWLCYCCYCPC